MKMPKEIHSGDRNKVTWDKLDNLSFADIKGMGEDFKPYEFVDEDDDEDQIYLAEYNLLEEKRLPPVQTSKKVDNYGKLKAGIPVKQVLSPIANISSQRQLYVHRSTDGGRDLDIEAPRRVGGTPSM